MLLVMIAPPSLPTFSLPRSTPFLPSLPALSALVWLCLDSVLLAAPREPLIPDTHQRIVHFLSVHSPMWSEEEALGRTKACVISTPRMLDVFGATSFLSGLTHQYNYVERKLFISHWKM